MQDNDRRPPRLRVMGLWLNETKDGKKYMAGNIGRLRVEVWKNDRPGEGENPPDYHVTITEAMQKPRDGR
ncbi:MAG: hypothetical protein MUC88_00315 [Planctomycetes bacterium]|jgi:hypothetical protein|nr:hypothetical protein [Planctomycetota bacterium]